MVRASSVLISMILTINLSQRANRQRSILLSMLMTSMAALRPKQVLLLFLAKMTLLLVEMETSPLKMMMMNSAAISVFLFPMLIPMIRIRWTLSHSSAGMVLQVHQTLLSKVVYSYLTRASLGPLVKVYS